VLLAALGTYFALLLMYRPAVPGDGPDREGTGRAGSPWLALCGVGLGVALLVAGVQMLVEGAVGLARELGVTERVIGLTRVIVGGSLLELAVRWPAPWSPWHDTRATLSSATSSARASSTRRSC
jgi:cation:H+ antiporter